MTPNHIIARQSLIHRIARHLCHAAVLIFCAWWLMATSMGVPPRDCFTGIGSPGKIQVLLGSSTASQDPSCNGLDGMAPGATMTLTLTMLPPSNADTPGCLGYATTDVGGLHGVSLSGEPQDFAGGYFTVVDESRGRFSPCGGTWYMGLAPSAEPAQGMTISPFDAGPAQPWIVTRFIGIDEMVCPGKVPGTGNGHCGDQFVVTSITNVTP